MKNLNYLLSAAVLVFMLAIVSCGGDDSPGVPADDQVGAKLTSAWTATSVVFETTQDRSTDYSNFVLTIGYNPETNAGSYSISGGPTDGTRPFATSGTWTFTNEIVDPATASFSITRNDGLVATISLTETTMQMTFVFADGSNESSRTEAVNGGWAFTLTK